MFTRIAIWMTLREMKRRGRLIKIEASGVNGRWLCRVLSVGPCLVRVESWEEDCGRLRPWGETIFTLKSVQMIEVNNTFNAKKLAAQALGLASSPDDDGDKIHA